ARSHDYKTLCTQVLAPALVTRLRSTGLSCEAALEVGLGPVREATISIGQITVKGSQASAIVLALAQGESASLDTLGLIDTSSGWRIASLHQPGG
ncbi:MAG TPA: hypothetical protein VE992_07705, partial [Solirubrobacteraceae bacterium]|nr:hypothetical protein [Solirubrobacteraceae bacterium]